MGGGLIKKLNVLFFSILYITLILSGCNNEISKRDKEIETLKNQVKSLSDQLDKANDKLESIAIDDMLLQEKVKVKDKFTWIKNSNWDNIVVAPLDSGEKYIFVNNQDILKVINSFFYINREVNEPSSGFKSDVPQYSYTFISDDQQYDVTVVARGIVDIDGHYYETNPYIHKLGDAFIKSEKWRQAGNIETRIAESGLIMTSFGPVFSEWRIHMLADAISDGSLINKVPPVNQDEVVTYTAYYFGEEISIKAYTNYINIKDGVKEYWYKLADAAYTIHYILSDME